MSNRRILFRNKNAIKILSVFLIVAFAITSIAIFITSRTNLATISHDSGDHYYYADDPFSYFEIKVSKSTNSFYNNGESPITNPFFTISNVEISVYDLDNKLITMEISSRGIESYKCYTSTVRIEVSEPTYCYEYQIEVIEHIFNPTKPILYTLAGFIVVGFLLGILFSFLVDRNNQQHNEVPNEGKKKSRKIKREKYLYEIVKRLPDKRICGISRTQIESEDKSLRCPYCRSYFIREYLIAWLQEKNHCPVCFRPLVEEQ